MTEESAWQTFSLIKKKEENKYNNNINSYSEKFNRLNDNHLYDTDTTDSEDIEYYKKVLKNNKNNKSKMDINFITPPKSNIDSTHSSPNENEIDSNSQNLYNKGNKDTILKSKLNHNEKEKGMESAWTKFINVINP